MHIMDVLEGRAGVGGVQWALTDRPVRQAFRQALSGLLSDGVRLGRCDLTRAKYKPGRKLTAYFDARVIDTRPGGGSTIRPVEATFMLPGADDPRGGAEQRLGMEQEAREANLAEPFRHLSAEVPQWGMRVQVSPLDIHFPQLVRLSTPSHIREILAVTHRSSNGRSEGAPDLHYAVKPVRYRPGQRHVLRYDPQAHGTRSEETLFAKLYRNGEGARAFRIANGVAEWLETCEAPLMAARPLLYAEEDDTILYRRVAGAPLSRYLRLPGHDVEAYLRRVGSALRMLHSAPREMIEDLQPHDLAQEIKSIARACEHIRALLPGAGADVESLLHSAAESGRRLPEASFAFAHGDLKADHLWVTPAGLVLIDFDTCYLADPAIDVGKFLADLEWWHTEYELPGASRAQQAFLDGYSAGSSGSLMWRARLYEALVLVKIAARRVQISDHDWALKIERLIRRAQGVLDGIMAII